MAGRGAASAAAKTLQNMRTTFERLGDTGFDKTLFKTAKFVSGGPGKATVSFVPQEEHLNKFGTLHGGMTASFVDAVTTIALIDHTDEFYSKLGVSTNLAVTYLAGAKPGEELLIEGRAIKVGKRLAFLDCEVKRAEDGRLVATGTHTKYVGN